MKGILFRISYLAMGIFFVILVQPQSSQSYWIILVQGMAMFSAKVANKVSESRSLIMRTHFC